MAQRSAKKMNSLAPYMEMETLGKRCMPNEGRIMLIEHCDRISFITIRGSCVRGIDDESMIVERSDAFQRHINIF